MGASLKGVKCARKKYWAESNAIVFLIIQNTYNHMHHQEIAAKEESESRIDNHVGPIYKGCIGNAASYRVSHIAQDLGDDHQGGGGNKVACPP